jgi:hypothetical protein
MASGFVLVLLAAGASGCGGPSQFDVHGKVKYNGAPLPLPGGQIVFVGPNGTQVAASIAPDGAYQAPRVTAGLNRIAVYYPNPDFQSGKRFKKQKGGPPPDPTGTPEPFLTPPKYATVDTSDLSVEVMEGTIFNADLNGPPIQ